MSSSPPGLTGETLRGRLRLISRGKVRDLYEIDRDTLLFVASDRISAFDVTMANPVPGKGKILNLLTAHWFRVLADAVPELRTHLITLDLPDSLTSGPSPPLPPPPPSSSPSSSSVTAAATGEVDKKGEDARRAIRAAFENRSMQVRRLEVLPIEAIVRGYITGSAFAEYKAKGTVHGMPMPEGLREAQPFPDGPIYTPSTKAPAGMHDENIHPSRAAELLGSASLAARVERLALRLYAAAAEYAAARGIIIADTKFEFALDRSRSRTGTGIDGTDVGEGDGEGEGELVLVDEVLTPDSSRFWPADAHRPGQAQDSFDKQFLRDWLVAKGLKGRTGVEMPPDVVERTADKYKEAWRRLTGTEWTLD